MAFIVVLCVCDKMFPEITIDHFSVDRLEVCIVEL